MFDSLLRLLIIEARQNRDAAHAENLPLETKRALATVLTKLEEAEMWLQKVKK